jgi:hypothetical protein
LNGEELLLLGMIERPDRLKTLASGSQKNNTAATSRYNDPPAIALTFKLPE